MEQRSPVPAIVVPVGLGLFSLGLAFGLVVVHAGLAWWWATVFTAVVYAGSLEFLLVGLTVAATPLLQVAATTLIVNLRHVFYALSFPLDRVDRRWAKAYSTYALTDEAYASLWRFLAEIDLIAKVKAEGRPLTERLPWLLTNFRAARLSDVNDGMWVRVFDIPRALAARTYERAGTIVLDVRDAEVEGGHVRVRLDASPSGSGCEPTTDAPDLELDVSALGAAYLGGTLLSDAALATGAVEHTPDSMAKATQLLRTSTEPWCATFF